MGVPSLSRGWGQCDPAEPRNRRRRASILIEGQGVRLLIDPGPDLREQLLGLADPRLDAVFVTHVHADHCHGIDDLRGIAGRRGAPVPVFSVPEHLDTIQGRFPYMFQRSKDGYYGPFLQSNPVQDSFSVGPLTIKIWPQNHVVTTSYGLRVGDFAYVTDVWELDDRAFEALRGIRTWIVAAVQHKEHPTHAHVGRVLGWIDRIRPQRAIFTHMNESLDYRSLYDSLPSGVEPGYDGMVIEMDGA